MIGSKRLSTIRREIGKAIASSNEDPIARLEQEIASAKRKDESTELLEGLK